MSYVEIFKLKEVEFAEQIKKFGTVTDATQEEDMFEHWDVKLETKIDVKALRKTRRGDKATDENIHWVELKNVNGNLGWLYGKADCFAFELIDYWVIVDKIKLQEFIKEKCKDKITTQTPALYKLYTRNGRSDIITLVKTIDLLYIASKVIKKAL